MLASGLPEKSSLHAKNIALVALDMIDIARDIVVADGEFPVRVSTPTTGRARLIRTRLIRSSTKFEVSLKSLPDSYHFMFKMHC